MEDKKVEKKEEDSFERDVRMFMVDFDILQKKYNLVVRPIIQPYGPDINISRPQDEPKEVIKK